MPQDVDVEPKEKLQHTRIHKEPNQASWQWFTTPPAIKRLFNKFPLRTYPVNELPQRTAGYRDRHALYIFTTEDGAKSQAPSFNPGCLKWQACLRFLDIDFVTIPSTNHASPTGALPFLLPSASGPIPYSHTALPIPSNRIQRWTREVKSEKGRPTNRRSRDGDSEDGLRTEDFHRVIEDGGGGSADENASDMRYEAYMSLLDLRIRNAYLYALYLSPLNFASIAAPLYIDPSSTNTLVRNTLGHQLQGAAKSELLKQSPTIDVNGIYRDCDNAFNALSELLGEDEYFFGERRPGLFDASVFAYTNVLLADTLIWKDTRMKQQLRGYQNLVDHQRRIAEKYFA